MIKRQEVIDSIRNLSKKYKDKFIDGKSEYELQYEIEQLLCSYGKQHSSLPVELKEEYGPVSVTSEGIFLTQCWQNWLLER